MSNRLALLILDGWGIGQDPEVDAIAKASTPVMNQLLSERPNSRLITYGMEVGLPEGQMGNSEVGHLNIGAGRIVYQQLAKINLAVQSGSLAKNQVLVNAIRSAVQEKRAIHFMGLLSDGGVHSHMDHLKCLIEIAEGLNARNVFAHCFLDGRDTAPTGGLHYLKDLQDFLSDKNTEVASVIGRYYAMDRDLRWDRTKLAYDLLVSGQGEVKHNLVSALAESYAKEVTDEFVMPMVQDDGQGKPLTSIKDNDLVIFFNFRTDRPRQLTRALSQEDFPEYEMKKLDLHFLTMTQYDELFEGIEVLFSQENLKNTLGEVIANAGLSQLRIAETEKYPHVTFFFSGGKEDEFEGEERILIPSPKVATYDLQPEMSAREMTEALLAHLDEKTPHFICLNFANTDMVGHTGVFRAVMTAAETVDECVGKLVARLRELEYHILIIADHGNADYMINPDGSPNTAHSKNPVPCILVHADDAEVQINSGKLGDLAPTILSLMEITIPADMTGSSLIR